MEHFVLKWDSTVSHFPVILNIYYYTVFHLHLN